jgi:hypothetical protein
MQFFRALLYPLDDESAAPKVAVTLLIAAIPILGFFAIKGYEYEISRAVRYEKKYPIPKWKPFWPTLKRGVIIRLAGLLYNIPTYIMLGISLTLWVTLFVQFFQADARTFSTFAELFQETLLPRLLVLLATLIIGFIANVFYWAGYIRYIDSGSFSAFFELATNLKVTFRTIWDDIIVAIYLFIMTSIVGLVSSVATAALTGTGVGAILAPVAFPAVSLTLITFFSGHLFGQLAYNAFGPPERSVPPIREAVNKLRQ